MSTNINPKNFPYEIILDWYKTNGRHDLPWREDFNPYKIWISEIFLQQTQVSRVKDYFTKVIEAFPTILDFAKLEYDDFFPYYK
jgi:A/G-specific adenine glycosylase